MLPRKHFGKARDALKRGFCTISIFQLSLRLLYAAIASGCLVSVLKVNWALMNWRCTATWPTSRFYQTIIDKGPNKSRTGQALIPRYIEISCSCSYKQHKKKEFLSSIQMAIRARENRSEKLCMLFQKSRRTLPQDLNRRSDWSVFPFSFRFSRLFDEYYATALSLTVELR